VRLFLVRVRASDTNYAHQGDCKVGYRPTPATCTTALAAACPGLAQGKSPCADCVYAHWTTLKLASCLNADAESYCVTDASSDDDEA
jgi:hypothetical protein